MLQAAIMRTAMAGVTAALVAVLGGPARADSYFDVEHARHIARAGGPVTDQDAELLERHGATSGTPDWRQRSRTSQYRSDYDDGGYQRPRKYRRRIHRD